jgi:hypothetical protein
MSVDPRAFDAARAMGERDGKYGLANYFDTYVVAGVSEECRAAYTAAYKAASVAHTCGGCGATPIRPDDSHHQPDRSMSYPCCVGHAPEVES